MVLITGDTHCPVDIHKLSMKAWAEQKELTRDDFLIICGDCGLVWDGSGEDRYWQDWFNNKPFTTLFVDGNHENFNLLAQYPVVEFHGGRAHQIKENVYHLMRGEVFTLDDKKFFVMGGATSHDKHLRVTDVTWWEQELPSKEELDNAFVRFYQHNHKFDYIITHCAPDTIIRGIADWYEHDILTNFLEYVMKYVKYKHWYFGHYHIDIEYDDKHTIVYDNIIKLD